MFKFRNFFFEITATPGDFNATHQPVSHGTKFKQQPHLSNLFSSTRHQSTTPSDFFHWPRREMAIFAYKRSTRTGSLNQTMTMESTLNSTKIWYFVRIFRAKIFQVKSCFIACCAVNVNKIYNVWLRKRIIRVLTKEVALGCHMLNAEWRIFYHWPLENICKFIAKI